MQLPLTGRRLLGASAAKTWIVGARGGVTRRCVSALDNEGVRRRAGWLGREAVPKMLVVVLIPVVLSPAADTLPGPVRDHPWWFVVPLAALLLLLDRRRSSPAIGKGQLRSARKRLLGEVRDPLAVILARSREVRLQDLVADVEWRDNCTFGESGTSGSINSGVTTRDPDGVFASARGRLLVLGNVGVGKSTFLAELTDHLYKNAAADKDEPVPVLLHAGNWDGRLPFTTWLAGQIVSDYKLPPARAEALIAGDGVIPVVDGLDELVSSRRQSFVAALNVFIEEDTSPLVVACRTSDYMALSQKLHLDKAAEIQPLSPERVSGWVWEQPDRRYLREYVQADPTLLDLVNTPLLLTMMCRVAVAGDYVDEGGKTTAVRRRDLMERYVTHVLSDDQPGRRGQVAACFSAAQLRSGMEMIASAMKDHEIVDFHPGRPQVDWLPSRGMAWFIEYGVTLVAIFMGTIIASCLAPWDSLTAIFVAVATTLSLFGLALLFDPADLIRPVGRVEWSWRDVMHKRNLAGVAAYLALIVAAWRSLGETLPPLGRAAVSAVFGLYPLLLLERAHFVSEAPEEQGSGRRELLQVAGTVADGLAALLAFSGIAVLAWHGPITSLLASGHPGATERFTNAARQYLPAGFAVACTVILWSAVNNSVRRRLLRFFLVRSGVLPSRLLMQLEAAAARGLLQRIGAGYRYIHLEFRDHLAAASIKATRSALPMTRRQRMLVGASMAVTAAVATALFSRIEHTTFLLVVAAGTLFMALIAITANIGRSDDVPMESSSRPAVWDIDSEDEEELRPEMYSTPVDTLYRRTRIEASHLADRHRLRTDAQLLCQAMTGPMTNPPSQQASSVIAAAVFGGCLALVAHNAGPPDDVSLAVLRRYGRDHAVHDRPLILYAADAGHQLAQGTRAFRTRFLTQLSAQTGFFVTAPPSRLERAHDVARRTLSKIRSRFAELSKSVSFPTGVALGILVLSLSIAVTAILLRDQLPSVLKGLAEAIAILGIPAANNLMRLNTVLELPKPPDWAVGHLANDDTRSYGTSSTYHHVRRVVDREPANSRLHNDARRLSDALTELVTQACPGVDPPIVAAQLHRAALFGAGLGRDIIAGRSLPFSLAVLRRYSEQAELPEPIIRYVTYTAYQLSRATRKEREQFYCQLRHSARRSAETRNRSGNNTGSDT